MRKLLLIVIGALLVSCGGSQSPEKIDSTTVTNNFSALEDFEKVTGGAQIVFNELEHQFPPMVQGDKVYHTFYFVNSGDAPLVLSDVTGSCGCTIPSYPEDPILPGEKGKIDVEINTENKPVGKSFNVHVRVSSNAIASRIKLKLRGVPIAPAE